MKCLRCGYCCIAYDVMIVDNPKLGIIEENIIHKPSGVKCKHLFFDGSFHSCLMHSEDWYKETPCFDFSQIESSFNSECRLGKYLQINKLTCDKFIKD